MKNPFSIHLLNRYRAEILGGQGTIRVESSDDDRTLIVTASTRHKGDDVRLSQAVDLDACARSIIADYMAERTVRDAVSQLNVFIA